MCAVVPTQLKDLQGQGEEAGTGGEGVVLARGRAHLVGRGQQQDEGHLHPQLHHLLRVEPEVLSLGKIQPLIYMIGY